MKDNITDVRLTEQQMLALSRKAGKSYSDLSPLRVFEEKYSGLKDVPAMPSGLVNKNGQLKADISSCIETLSEVRSFGAFACVGRSVTIDTGIYYSNSQTGQGVQLTNAGDAVRMQRPPVIADVLVTLALSLGDSPLPRLDAAYELPVGEAHLLFALIDVAREKRLRDMLSGDGTSLQPVSPEDILRIAKRKDTAMQWLAPYLAECLSLKRPKPQQIDDRLSGLEKSGLVKKKGNEWALTPSTEAMAAELLVIHAHTRIRSAVYDEKQGTGFVTDVRSIHGCSGAVLTWSHDEATVSLMGVSQAQLNDIVEEFLRPRAIDTPPGKAAGNGARAGSCAKCGAKVMPGDKFCRNCGTKIARGKT